MKHSFAVSAAKRLNGQLDSTAYTPNLNQSQLNPALNMSQMNPGYDLENQRRPQGDKGRFDVPRASMLGSRNRVYHGSFLDYYESTNQAKYNRNGALA